MKIHVYRSIIVLGGVFFCTILSHAASVPSVQDVSGTIQQIDQDKLNQNVADSLKSSQEVEIQGKEEVTPEPASVGGQADASVKVVINNILVQEATLLTAQEIKSVTQPFIGKELGLEGFREVADRITDLYRKKGYVTSFAFIRPQKVENNTLMVSVLEGRVGDVRISGNKRYSTDVLMRYLDVKSDQYFNYNLIRENVRQMNKRPDINGRAVLNRSQIPGATDVEIQVQERKALSATLGYNNFNSSYLERNKYSLELKTNNLSGRGDILSGEIQLGEAGLYRLLNTRYLFPLSSRTTLGAYYLNVDQDLGGVLKNLNVHGEGQVLNTFASYKLIDSENLTLNINPSFVYKNIRNMQNGVELSEDNVRYAGIGFDVDYSDAWRGRTIFTQEFDFGIPSFLGGLSKKDDSSSRIGGAGQFARAVTNIARVQSMPFSTVLMLKASGQYTNHRLPASEQFQLGGYYTLRGYPVSEVSGDRGLTVSTEYYVPMYLVPKDLKVPFTNKSWREAVNVVAFFDWGFVSNTSPNSGEIKKETLYSAGPGLRFNPNSSFSLSFDYGFVLGQDASDGSNGVGYIETKIFF